MSSKNPFQGLINILKKQPSVKTIDFKFHLLTALELANEGTTFENDKFRICFLEKADDEYYILVSKTNSEFTTDVLFTDDGTLFWGMIDYLSEDGDENVSSTGK